MAERFLGIAERSDYTPRIRFGEEGFARSPRGVLGELLVARQVDGVRGAGRRAWIKNGLDGLPNALSCPSGRLCVGVDNNSEVVISTNPAGSKRAWSTPVNIDSNAWTTGISCPSARLCVAVDAGLSGGAVLVSTNPTRGRGVWSRVPVDRIVLDKVACLSTTLCVAGDHSVTVLSRVTRQGRVSRGVRCSHSTRSPRPPRYRPPTVSPPYRAGRSGFAPRSTRTGTS
jgi:hypothetical protein